MTPIQPQRCSHPCRTHFLLLRCPPGPKLLDGEQGLAPAQPNRAGHPKFPVPGTCGGSEVRPGEAGSTHGRSGSTRPPSQARAAKKANFSGLVLFISSFFFFLLSFSTLTVFDASSPRSPDARSQAGLGAQSRLSLTLGTPDGTIRL